MLNNISPIVNSFMGGYQQGYPPNLPIGYNGYNGVPPTGFNNNNFYGQQAGYQFYESPFQKMEREKAEKAAAQEQLRKEVNASKLLYKLTDKYYGNETNSESLDKMCNPSNDVNIVAMQEANEYSSLLKIVDNSMRVQLDGPSSAALNAYGSVKTLQDKYVSDDCDMYEFFEAAGRMRCDYEMREAKAREKNLAGSYDSDNYRRLLGLGNPYSDKFRSANLDDMSISLPPSIKNQLESSYEDKKRDFLSKVMNSLGR